MSREEEGSVQTVSVLSSDDEPQHRNQSLWATIRDRQTYCVSAVTIANGANNIGIYVPLFASSNLHSLGVIVCVCYLTIGLWCFLSYHMTRNPLMTPLLARYGRKIFPFVLIYLGLSILIKSGTYHLLPSFGM